MKRRVKGKFSKSGNRSKELSADPERPSNNKSTGWFYSIVPHKVATGGISPLVPLLAIESGGTASDVGLISAVGSISSMIGGLFWDLQNNGQIKIVYICPRRPYFDERIDLI